ncbi:MAG: precorrin-6A/cobalt-precorrin-6A reductase [Pseudomonadota bacterium]
MTLLLLGGTREARDLAQALYASGTPAIASLAGVTSDPAAYSVPTRVGGFGGPEGLTAYLSRKEISCLVDATHPFAATMPHSASQAALVAGVPRLRLIRPEWSARGSWSVFRDVQTAVAAMPVSARCFATTGIGSLPDLKARPDCSFLLRTIEDPGALPAHIDHISGRPPFTIEAEADVMRRAQITHLLTKNSGGSAEKLDASDRLSIPCLVVRRPPVPTGPVASTVEDAVAWVIRTVAKR